MPLDLSESVALGPTSGPIRSGESSMVEFKGAQQRKGRRSPIFGWILIISHGVWRLMMLAERLSATERRLVNDYLVHIERDPKGHIVGFYQ